MEFSDIGIGSLLASSFNKAANRSPQSFPNNRPRGDTLWSVSDFGGQHKGQHFDTYAFLIFDLEQNYLWLGGQRNFRQQFLPNKRKMAYKAMNDHNRRNALIPFLNLADQINGWLVLFAVTKNSASLFRDEGDDEANEENDILNSWKPKVQEKLLRIIHFGSFLLSGLSIPGQNVMLFTDEDEVAANTHQLTQLTELYGRVLSNTISHQLGHIRCGTAASDDGSLALEDMLAIPDLGAGAFSEIATAMIKQQRFPKKSLFTFLPERLSWKSRALAMWLSSEAGSLRKISCVIEIDDHTPRTRVSMLDWHAMPGPLWLPKHPLAY